MAKPDVYINMESHFLKVCFKTSSLAWTEVLICSVNTFDNSTKWLRSMESAGTLDCKNVIELLCIKERRNVFQKREVRGQQRIRAVRVGSRKGKYKEVWGTREIFDECLLSHLLFNVQNNQPSLLFCETFSKVTMAHQKFREISFLRIQ